MLNWKKAQTLGALGILAALGSGNASAEQDEAKAGKLLSSLQGSVGVSWSVGDMSNSDLGLPSRTMNAVSINVLPSYRFGQAYVGVDFDYKYLGQMTALASAGGTNLRGKSYTFGIGGGYFFNPQWALQGSVSFLGRYNFTQPTQSVESDHLNAPLGFRVKGQYFPFAEFPLSFDLDAQYLRWGSFTITEATRDLSTSQWLAGLGVTFHVVPKLRAAQTQPSVIIETSSLEAEKGKPEEEERELAEIVDVKRTEKGLMVNLPGDLSFASSKSELNGETLDVVLRAGQVLAKNQKGQIRVEGHTDSSGSRKKNQKLSQRRAEAVKEALIRSGVKEEQITVKGHGQNAPIASNKTKAGRATNRRVEIYIER